MCVVAPCYNAGLSDTDLDVPYGKYGSVYLGSSFVVFTHFTYSAFVCLSKAIRLAFVCCVIFFCMCTHFYKDLLMHQ